MDKLEEKIRKNLKPFLSHEVEVVSLKQRDAGRENLNYDVLLTYQQGNERKTAVLGVITSYHGTVWRVVCNQELVNAGYLRKFRMDDDYLYE